jgi:hypothetical protein
LLIATLGIATVSGLTMARSTERKLDHLDLIHLDELPQCATKGGR